MKNRTHIVRQLDRTAIYDSPVDRDPGASRIAWVMWTPGALRVEG